MLGGWLWPESLLGRFKIVCANLRQLHLVYALLWRMLCASLPLAPESWQAHDVYVVDSLSTCVPLLRFLAFTRTVFYCHFPDQLMAPAEPSPLRALYRMPADALERTTVAEADEIVVNSHFTRAAFARTFPHVAKQLRVVYPGIDVKAYTERVATLDYLPTNALLSINRFEDKKDLALAVEAFAMVRDNKTKLVIAGGFDPLLADNVATLRKLQALTKRLKLTQHTFSSTPMTSKLVSATRPEQVTYDVLFLLNMTQGEKVALLQACVALLYTPSNEHFGIVPIEAMAAGAPVLSTNSGGPVETVITRDEDAEHWTGFRQVASAAAWAAVLRDEIMPLSDAERERLRVDGPARVERTFGTAQLASSLEDVVFSALDSRRPPIYTEVGFQKCIMFVVNFGVLMPVALLYILLWRK